MEQQTPFEAQRKTSSLGKLFALLVSLIAIIGGTILFSLMVAFKGAADLSDIELYFYPWIVGYGLLGLCWYVYQKFKKEPTAPFDVVNGSLQTSDSPTGRTTKKIVLLTSIVLFFAFLPFVSLYYLYDASRFLDYGRISLALEQNKSLATGKNTFYVWISPETNVCYPRHRSWFTSGMDIKSNISGTTQLVTLPKVRSARNFRDNCIIQYYAVRAPLETAKEIRIELPNKKHITLQVDASTSTTSLKPSTGQELLTDPSPVSVTQPDQVTFISSDGVGSLGKIIPSARERDINVIEVVNEETQPEAYGYNTKIGNRFALSFARPIVAIKDHTIEGSVSRIYFANINPDKIVLEAQKAFSYGKFGLYDKTTKSNPLVGYVQSQFNIYGFDLSSVDNAPCSQLRLSVIRFNNAEYPVTGPMPTPAISETVTYSEERQRLSNETQGGATRSASSISLPDLSCSL